MKFFDNPFHLFYLLYSFHLKGKNKKWFLMPDNEMIEFFFDVELRSLQVRFIIKDFSVIGSP